MHVLCSFYLSRVTVIVIMARSCKIIEYTIMHIITDT